MSVRNFTSVDVSVGTSETELITMTSAGRQYVAAEINNQSSGNDFNTFIVWARMHPAGAWQKIYSSSADFTSPAGFQFVITGIFLVADKEVAANASATVVIYEASADNTTTEDRVLFETAIIQDQIQSLPAMNVIVNHGKYVNAKTTDDDIHMTIMGYFLPKLP